MRKKRALIAIIIVFFIPMSVMGLTLDLDTCISQALKKNLELRQEEINLQAAQRATRQNWSNFLPDISIQGGVNYSDILFTDPDTLSQAQQFARDNSSPWDFTAGLSVALPLNSAVAYVIKQTKLAYESKLITYDIAKNKISSQVTKAFYSLLMQQENLVLLQDNISLSRQQYEKAQTNYQHGLISERMVLQSQLGLESTKLTYNQSLIDYQKQKRDFLMLLGFETDVDADLSGKLDIQIVEVNPEKLIEKYLYRRTDILSIKKNIEILENSLKQTIAYRKTPSLSISSRWTGTIADPFADNLNFGVSLSVPVDNLIPGSKDDQAVQSIKDDLKKTRLQLESTVNNAKLLIKNLAAGLKSAKDNIDLAKMQVQISERYYHLAEEGFNKGTVERLELEQARQDLLTAKQKLLSSQYQYKSVQIDLLNALNISDMKQLVEGE